MQEVLLLYLNLLISKISNLKYFQQFPIISIVNLSYQLLISQLLEFFQSPLQTSLSLMQISYIKLIDFAMLLASKNLFILLLMLTHAIQTHLLLQPK